MTRVAALVLSRCEHCHTLFVPRAGPCFKCGSTEVRPVPIAPEGVVLASTQLENPPEGWTAPHRLALVELVESARLLATVDGPLPAIGERVVIRDASTHYVATRAAT
jgi:uncharacterized OB-fold protein